jgi:hypothetical protein
MPGAHLATALALLSMAFTCVGLGFHAKYPDASSPVAGNLLFAAALFVALTAVVLLLHARDRVPMWLRPMLDDWIGLPAHRSVPHPDMKLIDVLAYACSCDIGEDAQKHPSFPAEKGMVIADTLDMIRQQARLGRLHVWAKPDATVGREKSYLLSLVPADQWPNLDLSYTEFYAYAPGKALAVGPSAAPNYLDIWLNKRQVKSYPFPGRRRLYWRLPWYRA